MKNQDEKQAGGVLWVSISQIKPHVLFMNLSAGWDQRGVSSQQVSVLQKPPRQLTCGTPRPLRIVGRGG